MNVSGYARLSDAPQGEVFLWNNAMWRRGRGIIYRAHPSDPFVQRCFNQRMKRKFKRKVSPSQARFERRRYRWLP